MPRRLAARTMRDLADAARRARPGEGRTGGRGLSRREEEILRMLAERAHGPRDRGGAHDLHPDRGDRTSGNILRKLDARNRAEAARRFAEGR